MKLNRLIAKHDSLGRTMAHRLIAARRVKVNDSIAIEGTREIDRFTTVSLDGSVIQQGERALHIMLHKPAGVVSVTVDPVHRTVIDLIDDPDKHTLHPAGRLDRSTSGLVLLTNDGRWSKRITDVTDVPKVYVVGTCDPITAETVEAFARGFHFPTENITTLPAKLEIIGERIARLTLREGRYHQVKRMFWRVGNRVVTLHRESIGPIRLPDELKAGEWRHLTAEEVAAI